MLNTVTLTMTDELTETKVERTIDITNAMASGTVCWELRGPNNQRENLENWIKERGNQQHDTILTLDTWKLNQN
tara:strand:- start:7093 stop:7314 length:222 start_codon:yes stop_codon:yes gene_type:complete